jgi:hypothetical protein
MNLKKTLLSLLIAAFIQNANAQHKTHEDSTEVINAAHRYAANFWLKEKDLQKFHAEHFPATSDYFKPDARVPKVLITDSLFVKTYKLVAFDQAIDEKIFHPLLPPNLLRPNQQRHRPDEGYTDPLKDIARKDARRFNLTAPALANLKTAQVPPGSDYFKPAASDASDPSMLNDSTYVKAFRLEAYNKAVQQK